MNERRVGTRYVVVGGFNTLLGIALFVALDLTLAPYIGHYFVLAVAQTGAILAAHGTQRRWVWHSTEPYVGELMRFSSVYVVFFVANLAMLFVAHELFSAPVIPAQVAITLAIVLGTFLVHRSWTFGSVGKGSDSTEKRRA